MARKVKPNHQERLVELHNDVVKSLQIQAINNDLPSLKSFMETVLTEKAKENHTPNIK